MAETGTFGTYTRIDPAQLAEFIRSPDGPVFRRLVDDGELVKNEAKRLVGVHRPRPYEGRARQARRPGTLRDSIVKRVVVEGGRPAVLVGSEDRIALWHHEGTVPHPIVPVRAPMLVFWSDRAGKVVRAMHVNHPGTKPNRYLTNALAVLRGR